MITDNIQEAREHRDRATVALDERNEKTSPERAMLAAVDELISVTDNLAARMERVEGALASNGIYAVRT